MNFAFPADLADVVLKRWNTFVVRFDTSPPEVPSRTILKNILEIVFFASLEREEDRPLQFMICYSRSAELKREYGSTPIPLIAFDTARPLSVGELRSLAPAIDWSNAAILVHPSPRESPSEESVIGGVLHLGSDFARARAGKSFYHQGLPYALTIEATGPGHLHIFQGGIRIALLSGGRIHTPEITLSDFSPVSEILQRGEAALASRISPPGHEPTREWSDFQWTAHLNTILCVVNAVQARKHGGAVLLVEPDAVETAPVKIKYVISEECDLLASRFIGFINLRHRIGDALSTQSADLSTDEIRSRLELSALYAERALTDATETIAAFAEVDGAVLLTSALKVVGFGAEILLDRAPPARVLEVRTSQFTDRDKKILDTEAFGMRHRSAARFVAATPGSSAIIVSQDGRVSFCWRSLGETYLKRGVNTANPNVPGA